jgi:DNA-directed RNA polymerase specialized sigma24 family protein
MHVIPAIQDDRELHAFLKNRTAASRNAIIERDLPVISVMAKQLRAGEDAVQEAITDIIELLDEFTPATHTHPLHCYYKQQLKWKAMAELIDRRGGRRSGCGVSKLKRRSFDDSILNSERDPDFAEERRLTEAETKRRFDLAVDGFEDTRKRVLWQFFYVGMSHAEILADNPELTLSELHAAIGVEQQRQRQRPSSRNTLPDFRGHEDPQAAFEAYTKGFDEQRKEFFRLYSVEGWSKKDIAAKFRTSIPTVNRIMRNLDCYNRPRNETMRTVTVTPIELGPANPIGALPPMGMRTFSCSYTSKKNSGNVTYIFNPCGYTPTAQEENHPSFGKYTRVQMAIDIPKVILGVYVPKPGDFFVGPDGYTYNVVKRQTESIFFCRVAGWCPQLSLNLEDTVTYSQATCTGSSSTGSRTVTYTAVGGAVAAAIEPMTAELGDLFKTKDFADYYMVYLASDPSGLGPSVISAGDLFTDQNDVEYEIVECLDRQRLDYLPAFRCVKKL